MKPKVTEIPNELSDEEIKKNLISLYKTINKIAKRLWEEGEDVSEYFYTKEEWEKEKEKFILL